MPSPFQHLTNQRRSITSCFNVCQYQSCQRRKLDRPETVVPGTGVQNALQCACRKLRRISGCRKRECPKHDILRLSSGGPRRQGRIACRSGCRTPRKIRQIRCPLYLGQDSVQIEQRCGRGVCHPLLGWQNLSQLWLKNGEATQRRAT